MILQYIHIFIDPSSGYRCQFSATVFGSATSSWLRKRLLILKPPLMTLSMALTAAAGSRAMGNKWINICIMSKLIYFCLFCQSGCLRNHRRLR